MFACVERVDGSEREKCRYKCSVVDVVVGENHRLAMRVEILLFACLVNLVNKGSVPGSFLVLFYMVIDLMCLIFFPLSFT